VGLHLCGFLVLLRAVDAERTSRQADDRAILWLTLPALAPAPPAEPGSRREVARSASRSPLRQPVDSQSPPVAVPVPLVQPPQPTQPATNWNLEANRAASDLLAANALEQRRDRSMGSTPISPYHHAPPRPSFPWSRQPLGKHFDADPHSGVVSLNGKRCMIGLFLIFPIFGCGVGHLDAEPGRGDLFDPKYKSQPLEVPRSLSEELADPR
jgi:hypothetical protein